MALHIKSTGIDFTDFAHLSEGTGLGTETLDEYEEGGWVAYWTDGTNDASNVSGQLYVRVGSLCQVDYNQAENWDDHSCTGTAHIKGLPFNTLMQGTGCHMQHRYVTIPAVNAQLAIFHGGSTDQISPVWTIDGTGNTTFQFEHMNASTAYDNYLGMSYLTT